MNFFELKYLILESFYDEVQIKNCSYEQASGICYEAFKEYICGDGVEAVVVLTEIIRLKIKHKIKLSEFDKTDIEKILHLLENNNIKDVLTESEYEYFEEDIQTIKYYYENDK